jgi:hypothetical protein
MFEHLLHQQNIIPNYLMMIYNLKQQTLVYLRHLMVVVIQQYETVLLAILTMVIIENNNQHCSRLISFFFPSCLIHSEHCSLSLSISFCVCACVCVCNFIFFLLSYICVLIFPNVNIALLRVGASLFLLLYSSFYLFYLC